MMDAYPPMSFEGEDRFDEWVAKGVLHKEVTLEPFDDPRKRWEGTRTVYYTPIGEEWRIPASKLIWGQLGPLTLWNETLERLEGVLFGYEAWQNDWWIDHLKKRGSAFCGASLCCAVDAAELRWTELAGFRALPPFATELVRIDSYHPDEEDRMRAFFGERESSVALVRFNVPARHLQHVMDMRRRGPWDIPRDSIAGINRHLLGSIDIVWQREQSSST